MTKEEIYKEYATNPIKWMNENNCITSKDIFLKMMDIAIKNNKIDESYNQYIEGLCPPLWIDDFGKRHF